MYISATTGENSGERSQAKQSRVERDFEKCADCRTANQFAVPPMHFTCPKHVMVLVCPICLDHEADYHAPKNCPAAGSARVLNRNPKVYFVPKEIKRDEILPSSSTSSSSKAEKK
ncbi:hypothetical protein Y032_0598g461 [Ancylostoma ceylanicum]|uniref:Nanos-type domain-containing protein n=1 Tax=Ancylostoma ceylanicum TaxID=53326 RepID=A0A016WM91_9BILA|nr:hypothetical protein Y032_0598g461 [Ancylostoma ceylanicum]